MEFGMNLMREPEKQKVDNCTPLEEDLPDSVLGSLISGKYNGASLLGVKHSRQILPSLVEQNLAKAGQEAELMSMQNRKLDRKSHKSASAKSNKRKSLKMMSSPIEKKLEFSSSPEIRRNPLSPVGNYSSDSRIKKK
ncbi:Uncharacterized protein Rs2_41131 [Raphanus sativus]|nr:Uncharacterized protein Rs2_41131 [Raphanus sativus]